MIIGHIDHLQYDQTILPKPLLKAFDFIKSNDIPSLVPGRYEIDGDKFFVLVQHYKSKNRKECHLETHKKYIDIQYVAKGEEILGFLPTPSSLIMEENLYEEKDIAFYKPSKNQIDILLNEGTYAILFPSDVHSPGGIVQESMDIIKLVFKIHIDLLKP